MDPIEAGRRQAARIHSDLLAAGADPWRPFDLVVRAIDRHDLWQQPVAIGDVCLNGGHARLDPSTKGILYGDTGSPGANALLVAHELGHVVMHGCVDTIVTRHSDPSRSAEQGSAVEKLADYGRGERREVQADLFARELVLPRSEARRHHEAGMTVADIADRLDVHQDVVTQQLLDALLLPLIAEQDPIKATRTPDPSQDTAIRHRGAPYLLRAGPGTGKTRTLVGRVESLIDEDVDPNGILVLTFSNKAATELTDRLALSRPEAAASVWTGTFHAFGLDVIRRFYERFERSARPNLVDKATAITMLERILPSLPLEHYRDLWDPVQDLSDVLAAISRAKDELVDHVRYRELADAMARAPADEAARVRAVRAREEAIVYEAYEDLLARADALDFGDLLMKPVRIMAEHPEVARALAMRHRHVLVDEYQDVNLATVRLINALAADGGERLWVVGDARQSICRFRGATSASMSAFTADYPAATVGALEVNYRSRGEIVETFEAFAGRVDAFRTLERLNLTADRGFSGTKPGMHEAGTPDDEVAMVAASVAQAKGAGIAYRDQAILCTTNDRLADFADGLVARDIPVLFLGPLFERPEVKDLLCLLSLFHDPRAATLARVATMPGFEMDLGDVSSIASHLRDTLGTPLGWLDAAGGVPGLGARTVAALERLRSACHGFEKRASPWHIASAMVLDRLGIGKRIAASGLLGDQMAGIATWQFLNFLRSLPVEGEFPTRAAVDRIRRLVVLGDEKALRQVPDAALGIDAVRIMTIHACKGLEFRLVHAPGLIKTGLPRAARPPSCPPPDGLIEGAPGITGLQASVMGHDEQEACLFFVLLSRARDDLRLYRSTLMSGAVKRRGPSDYLPWIAGTLRTAAPPAPIGSPPPPDARPAIPLTWDAPIELDPQHLGSYDRCGLRFLYTYVLGLGGRRDETPYVRMHNAVAAMVRWLDRNFAAERAVPDGYEDAFETIWADHGPADHGHAEAYRTIAKGMLSFLTGLRDEGGRLPPRAFDLEAGGGRILSRAHDVVRGEDGRLTVRRVATRRAPSSLLKEVEFAVLAAAAEGAFGEPVVVEAVHLTGDSRQTVEVPPAKRRELLEAVASHVRGIGAGLFAPKPSFRCPRCPHFFTCPGLPEGDVTMRRPLARDH